MNSSSFMALKKAMSFVSITKSMNQNPGPETQASTEPVDPVAARPKANPLVVVLVSFALVGVAALLNPPQKRHFEEIDQIVQMRGLSNGIAWSTVHKFASYNDYFLFSTVSIGGNDFMEERVLSYGFFGIVKTTTEINKVIFKINDEFEKSRKKPD